ncbi:MAG: RluA family pseudouridine synthase [Lachnospiraceae bacterium]|nr:RluA family pseudouridine synthase [Lachnospiraceae bacterium]
MRMITVQEQEAGQRLAKLLGSRLGGASTGFLYKMLRKKNITLNGKKADGSERLCAGDEIRIFLSEETYEKFASHKVEERFPEAHLDIIYEDAQILIVNKPAGMLSQKSSPRDVSLNEYMLGYLVRSGQWSPREQAFRPSVCSRLDRNTSGLVVCGKTMPALQRMAELLRSRELKKYYFCLVSGRVESPQRLEAWLKKDAASNRVEIFDREQDDALPIVTEFEPLNLSDRTTLLKVHLITGRPHQIRAHLASIGHPVIGDAKYGDKKRNDSFRRKFGIKRQLLHAWHIEFPAMEQPFELLSGKSFEADLPHDFLKVMQAEMGSFRI